MYRIRVDSKEVAMTGTLHQTIQGEIIEQYSVNKMEQKSSTRSNKHQTSIHKTDAIRSVRNIVHTIGKTLVASIITLTVLLIAQNIAVIILEGGRGVDTSLVL
jgi:hypothetical protein